MIQIYAPGNSDYDMNGNAVLLPEDATVTATLNGEWYLELTHPIDAKGRWKHIEDQAVIKAPSFNGEQLFRIISKSKTEKNVKVTAEPIFMDAKGDCFLVDVRPTKKTGQEALDIMTQGNGKYSGRSDIKTAETAYYQYQNLIEAINGSGDNAFLKRWGGEILYDNFTVVINSRVGGDYGVALAYGKNIRRDGIEELVDFSDVVTRIYPKAYNGYEMSGNGCVDAPSIASYPTVKAKTVTFDNVRMAEDVQEGKEAEYVVCRNQEELDRALQKECEELFSSGLDKPMVQITADMVLLERIGDYAEYKALEEVSLGDTIHLKHQILKIESMARVTRLQYDCIRKRAVKVQVGDFSYDFFGSVLSTMGRVDKSIREDGTVEAERVRGFLNGVETQLRIQNGVAKKSKARAILFEDLDPSSDLFGAMSIGTQGWEISRTRSEDGRSWVWSTAATAGGIVADVVVAGLLSDRKGKNFWNLETGDFEFSGNLKGATGTFSGDLVAAGGSFKGELKAATGSFKGNLEAAGGSFSGELKAATGSFSGDLVAAGGSFSGELKAATGSFKGNLEAAGGSFSGELKAATGSFSGEVEAKSGHIGNWMITDGNITNGLPYTGRKDTKATGMGDYGGGWAFWAGNGRFSVTQNGEMYAENANIAGYTSTSVFEALKASVDTIAANYISAETVEANYANIGSLNAVSARVEGIEASYISAAEVSSNYATIGSLDAAVARIGTLEADRITASQVKADYMEVANWTSSGKIRADRIDADAIKSIFSDSLMSGVVFLNVQSTFDYQGYLGKWQNIKINNVSYRILTGVENQSA